MPNVQNSCVNILGNIKTENYKELTEDCIPDYGV
jgi:hypothetical protein